MADEADRVRPAPPLTVSVPEAARMLGIGRSLAYELVNRGEIPRLKFGRRVVVPRAAVERLVVEAEQGGAARW